MIRLPLRFTDAAAAPSAEGAEGADVAEEEVDEAWRPWGWLNKPMGDHRFFFFFFVGTPLPIKFFKGTLFWSPKPFRFMGLVAGSRWILEMLLSSNAERLAQRIQME